MSDVRWIKLSTDLFNDEKIRYIEQLPDADSILIIWIKLLVLAGIKNSGGEVYFNDEIPYTDEMLAAIWHRKVNTIRLALETFRKLRMIEISNDRTIIICNWGKHQNLDRLEKLKQDAAERQRRSRQHRREGRLQLAETSRDSHVTPSDTSRDASQAKTVTESGQKKSKKEEERRVPSAVSLPGRQGQAVLADYRQAKRIICEKILNGKNPERLWSPDAENRLARMCADEGGIPMQEIEDIAWFRSLPKNDDVPELKNRRDPITETTLMQYWGDEAQRAASCRKKLTRSHEPGGSYGWMDHESMRRPDPPHWREFYAWKHDMPDITLPRSFWMLDRNRRDEYDRDYQTFLARAGSTESKATMR